VREARGDDDLVTRLPARHAFPDLDDLADDVRPDDMRQGDFATNRARAEEGVVVVGTDRAHPDQHVAASRLRGRHVFEVEHVDVAEGANGRRLHDRSPVHRL
jgi:hypothetical protein